MTYNPGSGTRKDVTRYALGARGGDMAETVLAMGSSGERTVRSYPLYDGHGNTVAQVARAEDGAPDASFAPVPGAPAFELGARRKYDAWGQVRWSEGAPLDQGHCGNLQHRRDAESGLVYMRARYYEPWTGRFLSEDPAKNGVNWYAYCDSSPTNNVDFNGKETTGLHVGSAQAFGFGFLAMAVITSWYAVDAGSLSVACGFAAIGVAALAIASAFGDGDIAQRCLYTLGGISASLALALGAKNLHTISQMTTNLATGQKTLAKKAVSAAYIYGMILLAELVGQGFLETYFIPPVLIGP